MKARLLSYLVGWAVASAAGLSAGEPGAAKPVSPEFEWMKSLTFDFDPTCGINPAKESHMHALTIRFDDPDTITTSCKAYVDGKLMDERPSQFKRLKP